MRSLSGVGLMDGSDAAQPRRLTVPIRNRWGEGDMAVLDFGPGHRPVDMVFAHANGFNAMTYRQLLLPLAKQFRIWAPDLRGHGRSNLPPQTMGRRNWHDHRDDLISLIEATDSPSLLLGGHSIGGTSSLLAAAQVPDRVKGLLLLDPVIWPKPTVAAFQLPVLDRVVAQSSIVKSTLRRRSVFETRDQAFASWKGRGAFKGWPDEVLRDYLADGLLETADGVKLACSPQWEASNYSSQAHNPWRALRQYRGPVRILRAEHGSLCGTIRPSAGRDLKISTVEGGGHLFPMTHPDAVRRTVTDLVAELGR
ncbi:alpha/beta fold hydrolase [Brevundimonas pishanensis]|uniref:alpha/beta fold hydrolase n=1 Tax=Brevundimonas pishanensis TaxID=2896315 RepID=UPI001FA78D1B|nr:alpha/beta hydrolase [Brevundimonas pishanensis]